MIERFNTQNKMNKSHSAAVRGFQGRPQDHNYHSSSSLQRLHHHRPLSSSRFQHQLSHHNSRHLFTTGAFSVSPSHRSS